MPQQRSLCPPRYLVPLCTTTSIPSSMRLLIDGRGESIIDHGGDSPFPREFRDTPDINDPKQRDSWAIR